MILRRFMKHVTDQNWFAVGLDVIVVIVGVYLGVYIGEVTNRSVKTEAAHTSLVYLEKDLAADINSLKEIIEIQTQLQDQYGKLREALLRKPVDPKKIMEIEHQLSAQANPTFYPLASVYPIMIQQGQLIDLQDARLVRLITSLYGNKYPRMGIFSDLLDQNYDETYRDVRNVYFDGSTGQLFAETEAQLGHYRSALLGMEVYAEDYLKYIRDDGLLEMEITLKAIRAYQLDHNEKP